MEGEIPSYSLIKDYRYLRDSIGLQLDPWLYKVLFVSELSKSMKDDISDSDVNYFVWRKKEKQEPLICAYRIISDILERAFRMKLISKEENIIATTLLNKYYRDSV